MERPTIGWKRALGCLAGIALIAVLILSIRWGEEERPRPEHSSVGKDLRLREFTAMRGTNGFRAELGEETGGMSSHGYRTRNILFLDATGESRWLLPDDDHVVEEYSVSPPETPEYDSGHSHALLGFALAKPVQADAGVGTLYAFDPMGRQVVPVAESVLAVHGAALAPDDTAAVLYEKAGGYVLAYYEIATLKKKNEAPVSVPRLQ